MRTLSLCSPGQHGLFWTHRDLTVSASWVPSPILYIYEYSNLRIHFHCHPPIYLSLKLNILLLFIVCAYYTEFRGQLVRVVFSYHVHHEDQFQQPLSHEPSDWPQHLFSVWTGYLDFQWSWENYVVLWTLNYVLSGHRILKEGVVSINKVIKRDSWEAKLRPGNWSMSMRKLRLLRGLVYFIGRGNCRDFDQKEMFLDL